MESVTLKRGILLVLVLCICLLMHVPTADARRRRSPHRSTNNNSGRPAASPGFTHYFVIVISVLGGILVLLCAFINSLRCLQYLLSRRNEKHTVRRRTRSVERNQREGNPGDDIDQSQLYPPPTYAEIVGEAIAPPPAYSSLHVGDAGWESLPPTSDAAHTEEHPV